MADFRSALASGRTLLLDGGMGTMLQARGLPAGEHPEQFCLDRPDVLRGIHADYLAAGADIILTCTFGGSPRASSRPARTSNPKEQPCAVFPA